MNQNAIEQERCLKEKPNEHKQKITTALTAQRTSADDGSELQEHYRNVTTKTIQQQQPLNKFGLNIQKVSGKPQSSAFQYNTTVKTQIARISYGKENQNQISSRSSLKDMDTRKQAGKAAKARESSQSALLIENFAKKKQEREQEIKEIQEMLNEIKSPQKTASQTSEESNMKHIVAETAINNTFDKDILKEVNESDNIKTPDTQITATAQSRASTTTNQNCQPITTKASNSNKPSSYRRSSTEVQLTRLTIESQDNLSGRVSRRDTTTRSYATTTVNKPRSKSVQLPLSAKDMPSHNRKVGYNPEKARQFMEMQKKQRKSQLLNEPTNKAKIEKEEIKKRLEELKKNTRKLLNKNMQKKENIADKNSPKLKLNLKPPETKVEEKIEETQTLTNDLKTQEFVTKTTVTHKSETERAQNSQKMPENPSRSAHSLKSFSETSVLPLIENHKRIGLLRKTENDKDFSFNSHKKHNFDKENQNLETLTKQLTQSKEKISTEKPSNKNKQKSTDNTPKETEIQNNLPQETNNKEVSKTDMHENNLKSSKRDSDNIPLDSLISKEIPKKPTQKETLDMPYWLRPSAAQVYPYNFIMAVRRKLEAIAQPLDNRIVEEKHNQQTSTTDLQQHIKQKKRESQELAEEKSRKKVKRRRDEGDGQMNNTENKSFNEMAALKHLKPSPQTKDIIEHKTLEGESFAEISSTNNKEESLAPTDHLVQRQESLVKSKEQSVVALQKHDKKLTPWTNIAKPVTSKPLTKSMDQNDFKQTSAQLKQPSNYRSMESLNSEITSNLSSISLQFPLSNTLTEVSSLRTESRRTFVHSNKQHLENSEDEVTSLASGTFSSPEKRQRLLKTKDFEFAKPRPVSPLSLEKVDKLKIKRKVSDSDNEKIDGEKDFTQLLEDFNRSLSQVIQVNEQLKSTLDKSQQILSPHSSRKSSDTEKQYSSDFEKSTSKMHTSADEEKLKKSLQKNNENLKQRKRQLFEIAEQVKPLLEPQMETQNIEDATEKHDDDNALPELNLNMDLKSISNSSQTTPDDKNHSTETEENYIQEELVPMVSPHYEKRLNEIEKLKETLKQTILESKEKRKEREDHHRKSKEKHEFYKQDVSETEKSFTQTTQSDNRLLSNQILQNSVDTQTDIESISDKSQKENSINTSHSQIEFKTLEKYEKQYKNNLRELNRKTLDSESYDQRLQKLQDNIKQKSSASSKASYSEAYCRSQKEQQEIFAKTYDNSDSKKGSSQEKTNIGSHRSREHTKSLHSNSSSKTNNNVSSSYSSAHSELESVTTRSKDSAHSVKKTNNNNDDEPITSSIAEAKQNTYESSVRENESVPLNENSKYKTDHSNNNTERFIKSHINRSRGDFQETTSKEAHLNETQFQRAIQVSSQISSTEFAQSADDEITSSVASKPYNKPGSNPLSSYKASTVNKVQQNLVTTTSPSKSNRRISIGSDIVRFFSQYDCESNQTQETANDSMSESSLNYSNVGLYDKLIQNENNKSQHLMALLKMREKALLDRTKGQIAWLEVQKARYKAKGLISHIAAIKKKQRGILLKMEKEREEIKRLLQTTTNNSKAVKPAHTPSAGSHHKTISLHNTPVKHKKERLPSSAPIAKSKIGGQSPQTAKVVEHANTAPILRATYELESSKALEELLKKREEDLRKRREHVEHLMQWHQRLDEEEAEVLNLERQLLNYNNVPHMVEQQQQKQHSILPPTTTTICAEQLTPTGQPTSQTAQPQTIPERKSSTRTPEKKRASRARKMEKRLKEIDKSLRELSHISASSTTTSGVMGQTNNDNDDTISSNNSEEVDFVRTTGMKLNKLWKRLTSQQIEKFEPNRRYKLCKSDLERLYEEAKMAVLKDFTENEERIAQELLEKSTSNLSSSNSPVAVTLQNGTEPKAIEIPVLNLNFSSGHSEPEEESTNNSNTNTNKQGIYSPSVAEEHFKAQELLNSSNSSVSSAEQQAAIANRIIQNKRLEYNVQMFLALSQRLHNTSHLEKRHGTAVGGGLQRSLSDTEISEIPNFKTDKHTHTSQMTIATISSQSNSSIATQTHQRSKSSIVEMANIPLMQTQALTQTPTQISDHTDLRHTQQSQTSKSMIKVQQNETLKDLKQVDEHSATIHLPTRSSVIQSVGLVTPSVKSQQTSAEVSTISEDPKSFTLTVSKQMSTYSGQVSSKLEELTAAVTQLTHMNALPSYDSVTQGQLKTNKCSEDLPQTNSNDESNLSTDASSYSLNFENITTDKHSSPGTSTNHDSLQNRTITSITYTKENSKAESSSGSPLDAKTFASTTLNSTKSKTFTKGNSQSELEDRILDSYEADFELDISNTTHIEDITIPTFETTAETSMDEEDKELSSRSASNESNEDNLSGKGAPDKLSKANEIKINEKPSTSITKTYSIPSPDRELLTPPPPPPPTAMTSLAPATPATTVNSQNTPASNNLMPDIINELELRRHQLILDNEHFKQYEHVTAVPYMYVREIPNKPPPPYVPPAHGSPMTTIFPSEDRIKDITFRRTHELYCEFLKTDYCNEKGDKLPSVMEEQITNIYERIILDICREYLEEHEEILRDGDPTNFHSQLAFFNPPNRLRCIQDAIYKEVRSCLAMDKTQPKRTQIYSVYGQRAKQDHIGKIIIQEMYDEDDRWCNFHREESEVFHLMVEEMINKNIISIAKEVLLEEGGTIDEEEVQETITDDNEANHKHEENLEENEFQQQQANKAQSSSSVLAETLNEDEDEDDEAEDQTYCINEAKQEYTVLNKTATTTTTTTKANQTESVDLANNSSTANALQTCT